MRCPAAVAEVEVPGVGWHDEEAEFCACGRVGNAEAVEVRDPWFDACGEADGAVDLIGGMGDTVFEGAAEAVASGGDDEIGVEAAEGFRRWRGRELGGGAAGGECGGEGERGGAGGGEETTAAHAVRVRERVGRSRCKRLE